MLRYLQIVFLILLFGCSSASEDEVWNEVNEKGRFVDYFRFALLYEDSDYLDVAYDSLSSLLDHDSIYIAEYYDIPEFVSNKDYGFNLYLYDPYDDIGRYFRRNVYPIKINNENSVLYKGEDLQMDEVRIRIERFLINPDNIDSLSEQGVVLVDLLGERKLSKGIIEIRGEFDEIGIGQTTKWESYFNVYWNIKSIYRGLREDASIEEFNKPYDKLDIDEKKAVDTLISFYCLFSFKHNTGYAE